MASPYILPIEKNGNILYRQSTFYNKMQINKVFLYVIMASFAVALLSEATGIGKEANATPQATVAPTVNVEAGAGNASMSLSVFSPQAIEISAGESVTWINPTKVPEPHTVTFVLSNETYAEIFTPFAVDNSTQFIPVQPNANSEPTIVPQGREGTKLVVALNDRAFNPFVIDAEGNTERLTPNASYNMKGTEKYVNSGTITPKGLTPPAWPPINEFTVTFEKPGNYKYLCIFHPWMTGSVSVK
jgi:plastocyanin